MHLTMESDVCYICYESATNDNPFCKPLPCLCKGSIHIHNSCLVILRKNSTHCGICKTEFTNNTPGFTKFNPKTSSLEYINEQQLRHVYTVNNDRLIHGPMYIYYPSGRLHSTYEYIYGEINGIMRSYYDNEANSLKQTVRYIANKMDGELILYYENATVYKTQHYKFGQSAEYEPLAGILITN